MATIEEDNSAIKLRLTGLTGTRSDEIENYFFGREQDLKEVTVKFVSEDTAIVELSGQLKDVQRLLEQPKHRLSKDRYFSIEKHSQQDSSIVPTSEIVVHLCGADVSEDRIKDYLESSESGGVGRKQVLQIKLTSEGIYRVRMSNIEDCHIVGEKKDHNIEGTRLIIRHLHESMKEQHHPLSQTTPLSSTPSASYFHTTSNNCSPPFNSSYAQSHCHPVDSSVFMAKNLSSSNTYHSPPTLTPFCTTANYNLGSGSLAFTNAPSHNAGTSRGFPLQSNLALAYSPRPPPEQPLDSNQALFPHASVSTTAVQTTSQLQSADHKAAIGYGKPLAGANFPSSSSTSQFQATPSVFSGNYSTTPITSYQSSGYGSHGLSIPYSVHSRPSTSFVAGISYPPNGGRMNNASLHSSQPIWRAQSPLYPPATTSTSFHLRLPTALQELPLDTNVPPSTCTVDRILCPSHFSMPRTFPSISFRSDLPAEINTATTLAASHVTNSVPTTNDFRSDCLIISDVPPDHNKQSVILTIEDALQMEEEQDFMLTSHKSPYRLVFHKKTYSHQELIEMTRLLKKENLTANCCEPSRIVRVENISNEGFMNKHALRRYFEKANRSGGGKIESIEEIDDRSAFHVTFEDFEVISSIMGREHTKLGPCVKLTIVDGDESEKTSSQETSSEESSEDSSSAEDTSNPIEPPRTIVISGVTKKKFKNEMALKSYFENPQQSGGGEIEEIIYSKNKAVITFKDPSVIFNIKRNDHSQLGSNVRLFLKDGSSLSVPQDPLFYPIETVVGQYLQSVPEVMASALSQLQVQAKVDVSGKIIVVTPNSSSLPNWQVACQASLNALINEKVEIANFPIIEEARGEILTAVMKHSQQKEVCFKIDHDSKEILVAGSATAIATLKTSIEELHATVDTKEDSILFDNSASLVYFKSRKLTVVKAQYPNVRISLNCAKQSLDVYGSIRDLREISNRFSGFCKHSHVYLELQMVQLKFLDRVPFEDIASGLPNASVVVPFLQKSPSGEAECFFLLYSDEDEHAAKNIAKSITDRLKLEKFDLPKSFSPAAIVSSTEFQALVQQFRATHVFEYDFENGFLVVVGLDKSAVKVGNILTDHIIETCATTQEVPLNVGMWRFINSRMKQQWANCLDQIKGLGVKILEPTVAKQGDSVHKLELKGELERLALACTYIEDMQSCVATGSFHFERPGLLKFFGDDQGRGLLKGIEASSGVCIEMSSAKKQTQDCPKFDRVCTGTTAEFKVVNVYTGDITLFDRADVIVNAANGSLQHAGGVALAIAKKGGLEIQKDSDDYIQIYGPVEVGKAILFNQTGALPPPYKAIVHAVGPQWDPDSDQHKKETALLKKTCKKALNVASHYGSIAIPAISGGAFGFPPDVCADSLLKGVAEFSKKNPLVTLNIINFIILEENVPHFQKAIETHLLHHEKKSASLIRKSFSDSVKRLRRKRTRINSVTSRYPPGFLECIKITSGSILDVQAEALVNSTNCNLEFGGVVAKALLKAAGDTLKSECAKKAPVPLGSVVITRAGNLKCKNIMHVVLPEYDGPGGNAEQMLRKVVITCLQECTKLNLTSIAFPSIGAGTLKYDDDLVAKCLLDEAVSYLEKHQGNTSVKQIRFVIYSKPSYQAFCQHFKTFSTTAKGKPLISQASARTDDLEASISQHEQIAFRIGSNQDQMLVVLRGDITDEDSNVIVNTTNEQLVLNDAGEVSKKILSKAGPSLQAACKRALIGQGSELAEGKVVITKATGDLKCREVFHVCFASGEDEKYVETILNCLQKAEAKKHTSIAFPAIGTGGRGYSPASAASGIIQAVKTFTSTNPTHLKTIRIVLYQQQLYQQFVEAFQGMGNEDGSGWSLTAAALATYSAAKGAAYHMIQGLAKTVQFGRQTSEENATPHQKVDVANAVVFTIYGETDRAVQLGKDRIKQVLKTQFVTETIEDPEIGSLEQCVVDKFEREASEWQVQIETDVDPGLQMIKLHGCLNDVLNMKDKIRQALSDSKQKKTVLKAAEAVYQHTRWIRQLPDDEEEYDPLTNYEIEEAYQLKQPTFVCEKDFMIDFSSMEETELDSGDKVPVYRNDLALGEKPAEWVPMPTGPKNCEALVHLVSLTPGCPEYGRVEDRFTATMMVGTSFSQIVSIERMQNPVLFGQYFARRKEMDKHNPKAVKNERWLFHGTDAKACPKINTQGFNRMFRGKNGVKYGQGVYFARDASYSDGYSDPDTHGEKRMYLAYVLVGEYTQGIEGRLLPPPKKPKVDATVLFDSTVDTMINPRIFVVYSDAQVYPAYLITYK